MNQVPATPRLAVVPRATHTKTLPVAGGVALGEGIGMLTFMKNGKSD